MLKRFLSLIVYFFLIVIIGFSSSATGSRVAVHLGLLPEAIPISGTGSMYPTFPKGEGTDPASLSAQIVARPQMYRFPGGFTLMGKKYFSRSLHHGDIVSFENSTTDAISEREHGEASGFVKRVIGLPGDVLEIRDGFVWINGARLSEEYTASGRSTFGGHFLSDCHPITIPEGQVFVMGDNRKGSNDSRHEVGFVNISEIDHVLAFSEQQDFRSLWRDASGDEKLANKSLLDVGYYLKLLNQKRTANKLSQLKHEPKLDLSAARRADVILKYNDFSFAATRSGYTMQKALVDVGYSNITWGESPTVGYYTAEELIENYFQFPDSRKFLLNKDFQETGIATKIGELNGCPVQIVVQHFAGYIPPNYKSDVVSSWTVALEQQKKVLPSWEQAKNYGFYYDENKQAIDEVTALMKRRVDRLTKIVNRMTANQWLTKEEQSWVDDDPNLIKQITDLTSKLNNQ